MRKSLVVPFLALLAGTFAPAVAAPPPPPLLSPEGVQQDVTTLGAWVQRINDAVLPANTSLSELGTKMQALTSGSDPAALRANAGRLRALVAQTREQVVRSQVALAAIQPIHSAAARASGVDSAKVLSDVRDQMAEMLRYLGDCDALVDAIEKNDVAAMRVAAPKLIRSSALLLDGRVLTYRNRQAPMSPEHSAYQALGVTIDLYQAMSVSFHAWLRAHIDHQPKEAADEQRTQFLILAREMEATVEKGRANAARERAAVLAEMARSKGNKAVVDVDMRAGKVIAGEEKFFAIGDQVAAWLRSHAAMTADQLAAQEQPELTVALAPIEEQLIAAGRAQADAMVDTPH